MSLLRNLDIISSGFMFRWHSRMLEVRGDQGSQSQVTWTWHNLGVDTGVDLDSIDLDIELGQATSHLRLIRPPTVIRKAPSGPVPVSIQFWSLYTIFSGWKVISSKWYLWSSIPGKSSGENKIMDSIIQDIYWTRIKANINDLENLLMIYYKTFHDLIQDTKCSIFSC